MGLNLLLSTNHIVIHSYSPVADFLLVVMCLLALLLIRQTFIKQSRTFRIFKSCFALLFIAAVSNIAFYYADLFSRQNTLLWILRAVYHISLLSLFCLYIAYLKILIVFPKNIGRKYTFLSFAIFVLDVDRCAGRYGYEVFRVPAGGEISCGSRGRTHHRRPLLLYRKRYGQELEMAGEDLRFYGCMRRIVRYRNLYPDQRYHQCGT